MGDGETVIRVDAPPAVTPPPEPIDLRWPAPPPVVFGQVVELPSIPSGPGMVVGQTGAPDA